MNKKIKNESVDALFDAILTLKDKKQCPSCNKEIEANVKFCPNCGAEQPKVEEPKKEEIKEEDTEIKD